MKRRLTLERLLPENLDTRRLLIIGGGLFLGSAIVTLIVLLAGSGGRGGDRGAEDVLSAVPASAAASAPEIGIADLILPHEANRLTGEPPPVGPPYLLRAPMSRWSEEQIKRYWVPLGEIAVDRVMVENDQRIEELFEGVP